jgi:hypothetical protein
MADDLYDSLEVTFHRIVESSVSRLVFAWKEYAVFSDRVFSIGLRNLTASGALLPDGPSQVVTFVDRLADGARLGRFPRSSERLCRFTFPNRPRDTQKGRSLLPYKSVLINHRAIRRSCIATYQASSSRYTSNWVPGQRVKRSLSTA